MFLQIHTLLLPSMMMNEASNCIELSEKVREKGDIIEIFVPDKKLTEEAQGECVFKNC